MLDRSQPANLFDAAQPEAESAGGSTQPLPRLGRALPPPTARPRRARPPRAPGAPRASLAPPRPRPLRMRLAAIASAARRQARFLPGALLVLVLLTHPVGCDRATPTAPARRAATPAPRLTAPVIGTVRSAPPALPRPRPRLRIRRAPRAAAHRRARVLTHAAPAPAPTRGPEPSSDEPSPVASATRASAPAAAPADVPPARSRSSTRPAPPANRSERNGEFGFEAQAAHQ